MTQAIGARETRARLAFEEAFKSFVDNAKKFLRIGCKARTRNLSALGELCGEVRVIRISGLGKQNLHPSSVAEVWRYHYCMALDGEVYDPSLGRAVSAKEYLGVMFPKQGMVVRIARNVEDFKAGKRFNTYIL